MMESSARWLVVALSLATVGSVAALLGGADWLLWRTPPLGIPVGNLIASTGLVSAAGIPIVGARHRSTLRRIALAVFILALCWLPISIALAGNVDHVFNAAGAARFQAWLAYTALLVVAALAVLTGRIAVAFARQGRRREGQGR